MAVDHEVQPNSPELATGTFSEGSGGVFGEFGEPRVRYMGPKGFQGVIIGISGFSGDSRCVFGNFGLPQVRYRACQGASGSFQVSES